MLRYCSPIKTFYAHGGGRHAGGGASGGGEEAAHAFKQAGDDAQREHQSAEAQAEDDDGLGEKHAFQTAVAIPVLPIFVEFAFQ